MRHRFCAAVAGVLGLRRAPSAAVVDGPRRAALGAFALVVAALLTCAPSVTAKPFFGFNDSIEAWGAGAEGAKALGADAARIPMGWNQDPADFADMNATLKARGLRPIIALWGCEPPPLDAYAQAVAAWTAAYPKAVIQLWNEPNHPFFGDMSAERAGRLARVGAFAARSVRPKGPIVGPALAPSQERNLPSQEYRRYFRSMYQEIPDWLHIGAAVHVFPYGHKPWLTERAFYSVAERQGTVWVTEVGLFGTVYGYYQPALSAQAYSILARRGARAIVFHRLLRNAPVHARPSKCPSRAAGVGPSVAAAPSSDWETAANMSVLDNPWLAHALQHVRSANKYGPGVAPWAWDAASRP